ncbi:MAG: hypothetical protein KF891_06670 [Rhizobacter sp.]|nr:hypothetical protein [Rhizobacter sp.]
MFLKLSQAVRLAAVFTSVAMLQGCVTTSQFTAVTPGTTLSIRDASDEKALPRSEGLTSKATGQYEFMAVAPQGDPLYGILPLKVNGGKIVASIMFFAPALFIGGFRDPYAFYEVDPAARALRYRFTESEDWYTYVPTKAESQRAKTYFDALANGCTPTNIKGEIVMVCPTAAAAK